MGISSRLEDAAWRGLASGIESLIAGLSNVNFDVSKKSPDSTRDLFKGLYQSFVPRALRHALGEFYTPDWLAGHVMNQAGWQRRDSLTDPTCGTGTFLLEGLRKSTRLNSSHANISYAVFCLKK